MKAVYFEKHGTIDNLIFGDWPDPAPGPAQCLVRVKAVSLNGFDPMVLRGIPGLKTPLPMIPGADFAGDVISIGANVPPGRFKPGDRVQVIPYWPPMGMMGETLRGGCCELVAVDHVQLLPIPDAVSYVDAATLPTAYGTALRMVNVRGEIEPNEVVLVLGATGGVGTCAVQLCKLRGAIVVACASSAWKSERLKQLGADMVIDTSTQNFVEVLHGKFGKPRIWGESGGVDVVINYIGGDTWVNSLKVLKRSGRMLTQDHWLECLAAGRSGRIVATGRKRLAQARCRSGDPACAVHRRAAGPDGPASVREGCSRTLSGDGGSPDCPLQSGGRFPGGREDAPSVPGYASCKNSSLSRATAHFLTAETSLAGAKCAKIAPRAQYILLALAAKTAKESCSWMKW
jgi:alcohol dehydrogenase